MQSRSLPMLLSVACLASISSRTPAADDPKGTEFFENKIRPVLVNNCYECHSAKSAKLKGGLLLDTKEGLLKGGDTGPAIVPGKPAESLLLKSLLHEKKLKMPPEKPLPAHIVADFEKWIAMGAPDTRTGVATGYKRLSLDEAKSFWSFIPVQKPATPKLNDSSWAITDADRFIQAKLEEKGLRPGVDADRATLIRRLSFDLTGLPPKPEEVDAFVRDTDPKAVERLVDRLLASPSFGERWGRYWLDIARYAESNGNADNVPFPDAWKYRDYVIKATNQDRPYDRFIREQVAGDLLPTANPAMKDELLIATGFLALTSKPRAQNNPDYKYDLIADQIDVTSRSVLALSVMCSRCHDHKFDPISTKEYYSLAGIFDSSHMLYGENGKGGKFATGGGLHDLSDGSHAMGMKEGSPKDSSVCVGGDSTKFGEKVPRSGYLRVATLAAVPQPIKSGSGRLELAEWLTAKENPLTARVAVNRIWMHLFGQGIVKSVDNFGFLGDKPSHPEMLDHLAGKFMEDGWSTKKMIRYLVLSRTYQQACHFDEAAAKIDPDNILHWRMDQRRLDAEAFRDAVLAISGELDLTPPKGSSMQAGGTAKKPAASTRDGKHRSVYLGIVRGAPLPESLSLFDVANPNIVVAQREETTGPAQALYLMNSNFVINQSQLTAQALLNEKGLDDEGRIDLAYRKFFARTATSIEKDRAVRYIAETSKDVGMKPGVVWASFCQTLIASAEFRYIR